MIEFKRDKSARIAMNQIKDSGYADQFEHDKQGKTIHLLGISFSSRERNINQWQDEIL
ncbi:MAG: PD-(D/E)XK nuclease domain-containing protein [Sphaerochaetaceae bacterium]|nr:PD-(D/E)XK nuclease domain-containing protein [Sphaerochaetaceae bacterium]